jgi:hypothetical protein
MITQKEEIKTDGELKLPKIKNKQTVMEILGKKEENQA